MHTRRTCLANSWGFKAESNKKSKVLFSWVPLSLQCWLGTRWPYHSKVPRHCNYLVFHMKMKQRSLDWAQLVCPEPQVQSQHSLNWVYWNTSIIPALWKCKADDQTYKVIFSYLVRRCKDEKGRRMLRERYSTDAIHLVSNTKKGSFIISKVAWLSLPIPARDTQHGKEKSQGGQVRTESVPQQTVQNFTWFFGG